MKNNMNNLISEELKKATLLFNYNTKKTLTENIDEQTNTGFKAPNLELNPNSGLNVPSIQDMVKNFQSAASSTTNGQNPSPEDFTKMFQSLGQQVGAGTKIPSPEEFSKKLQSMTNKSPEEMSKMFQSMIAGTSGSAGTSGTAGTNGSTGTSGSAGTSVLITKNPNDKAYDYMMKDGKYYFKGKAGTTYATKYPDWREAKVQKGIDAIKALFDKNPKGDTPSENSNAGTSGTAGTAGTTGTSGTAGTTGTSGTAGTNGTAGINNGIVDSDTQSQIQGTISDDEEV